MTLTHVALAQTTVSNGAVYGASGTYVIPAGVGTVTITAVGGGGGGGGRINSSNSNGGGGGAGALVTNTYPNAGGVSFTVTIGTGGSAGTNGSLSVCGTSGGSGSTTTVASGGITRVSAAGGGGGGGGCNNVPGAAGTAGGNPAVNPGNGGVGAYWTALPGLVGDATTGSAGTVTFTWTKSNQTLTCPDIGAQTASSTASNATLNASSSAGANSGALTYTAASGSVCTVSGSTAQWTNAGTCSYNVSAAGSDTYNSASQSCSFAIDLAPLTLNWTDSYANGSNISMGTSATISASSGATTGVNAVQYAASPGTVCGIDASSGALTLLATGDCAITASQSVTSGYTGVYSAPASIGKTLHIAQTTPTLGWPLPATLYVGTTTTTPASSNSSGAISYSSSTTSVCTIDAASGAITTLAQGTCIVSANQAAAGSYAAGNISDTISVSLGAQTLTCAAAGSHSYGDAPFAVPAPGIVTTANQSAGTLSYGTVASTACTVSGSTVTISRAGQCQYQATAAATTDLAAGSATCDVTIATAQPTLSWASSTPGSLAVGQTGQSAKAISTATDANAASITYASLTPGVCAIDSATGALTPIAPGNCTVTANQAAVADYYNAASAITRDIAVGLTAQTLTFGAQTPASRTFVPGGSFNLSPLASSDHADPARPIVYSIVAESGAVCSLNGVTVTMLDAGQCTIAADQAGDDAYAAAAQVRQTVTLTPQTRFTGITVPASGMGGTATASFTGGGPACRFDTESGATAFVAAPDTPPAGQVLLQGMFQFRLTGCEAGSTITMTMVWPQTMHGYAKYGKASAQATSESYFAPDHPSIAGDRRTVQFTVTDGAVGDEDGKADGSIIDPSMPTDPADAPAGDDPGSPVDQAGAIAPVPALGGWNLALLALLLASLAGYFLASGRKNESIVPP